VRYRESYSLEPTSQRSVDSRLFSPRQICFNKLLAHKIDSRHSPTTAQSATEGWQLSCCTMFRQEDICSTSLRTPKGQSRVEHTLTLGCLFCLSSSRCRLQISLSLTLQLDRESPPGGTGTFLSFNFPRDTFLVIQPRLASFLVCLPKVIALLNVLVRKREHSAVE